MADVFEDYSGPDADKVIEARMMLVQLILRTPHLDWLLLTKRPENIVRLWPPFVPINLPNVWLGCTVEDQDMAGKRLPHLLKIPAAVRFVSYEPALGPVDFVPWLGADRVNWLIVGGESGPGARAFNPAWADWALDACRAAGVPIFIKQMGSNPMPRDGSGWRIKARKGDNPREWPLQFRGVQEFPR